MDKLKYKVGDRCFYRGHIIYVQIVRIYDESKKIYSCIELKLKPKDDKLEAFGDIFTANENELFPI